MFDIAFDFPAISPIALEFPSFEILGHVIGPLAIRWYALGYIFGIIIAWNILSHLAKNAKVWNKTNPPFSVENIDDFIFYAILGILLGGRIGYVLFYAPEMLSNPVSILKTWEGGMSFHGGIIGVMIAVIAISIKNKIDLRNLADGVALASPLGIGLVRITNFINQELWGHATNVPWAVIFRTDPLRLPRHPSQLYEAALEGFILFFVLFIATFKFKTLTRPGLNTGLFLIIYALSRIIVENFREPDAGLIFGLTRGMFYSIPLFLLGVFFIGSAMMGKKSK